METACIHFLKASDWDMWLSNHQDHREVWLKIAKKGSGAESITIPEALEVALCYGWIDSHRKSLDQLYYLQRYSPRQAKSPWSMINVKKAESLIASGRMQAPGYAEILAAQKDGRWNAAYDSQRNAAIPPDLEAALEKNERCKEAFFRLDKTSRYAIMLPILKAVNAKSRLTQLENALANLESVP